MREQIHAHAVEAEESKRRIDELDSEYRIGVKAGWEAARAMKGRLRFSKFDSPAAQKFLIEKGVLNG